MDTKSPVYFAEQAISPLLIFHGINDPRVTIEHSDRMVAELEKHNKPVEYIRIADEGHRFDHWKNELKLFRETEDFLASCIGGRSSGFDFFQLGSWAF